MSTEIIEILASRFVTRQELMVMLGLSDRATRKEIERLKMKYPIIHTSNVTGYKIATSKDEIDLVRDSIKNNRNKALSIFKGNKQLKTFLEDHDTDMKEPELDLIF